MNDCMLLANLHHTRGVFIHWTALDWTGVYAIRAYGTLVMCFRSHPCKINYFQQSTSIGDVISDFGNAHAKLINTNRQQVYADLLTFVNNEHITRYSRCESLVTLCFL